MDYGKGGITVHVICMRGCGTEWDVYVPAGGGYVETCDACMAEIVRAFWAIYEEAHPEVRDEDARQAGADRNRVRAHRGRGR